jgi:hypothetical protein
LDASLETAEKNIIDLQGRLKRSRTERTDGNDRSQNLKLQSKFEATKRETTAQLQNFADCDPEYHAELQKMSVAALDAANRWTDNVFCMQTWACDKFGCDKKDFNKGFDVDSNLDYLT